MSGRGRARGRAHKDDAGDGDGEAAGAEAAASPGPAINRPATAPAPARPLRRKPAGDAAHGHVPPRSACRRVNGLMDLNKMPTSTHGHDFHNGLSRVVMVRKTEQRTFASKNGEEPKFETVTRETVQTFSGSRSQKSTSEKRDTLKKLPQDLMKSLEPKTVKKAEENLHLESIGNEPLEKPTTKMQVDELELFMDECLKAHNEFRALHKVPAFKLNKKLCKYSLEWAKHLANRGQMEHRPNSEYGENLFCIWSSDPKFKLSGKEPVDNWYEELKNHPFGREPRDLRSGHFSQVVWRESRELGVGLAKSKNGQYFVVCNYNPPGNFVGSFTQNVPPVGGFAEIKEPPSPIYEETIPMAQTQSEFEMDALRAHNEYRKRHGVPPLQIDREISKYATEWASTLAQEDRFQHRPNGKYGENIFCHWSSSPVDVAKIGAKDACLAWYNEIKDHDFTHEPKTLKSGHFTQMIWKSSRKVGMGIAHGKSGRVVIVANYEPRGNYVGRFVENVPPPQ